MRIIRLQSLAFIISMMAMLLVLNSCTQKNQASGALSKADERIREAERYQAPQQDIENLKKSIERARNSYNQQAFKEAKIQAKSVAEQAKSVVDEARRKFANTRYQDARDEIGVAAKNDGKKLDPEKFQEIQDTANDADEARKNEKWEKAINLSEEVINEVTLLLEPVKIRAESKLTRAEEEFRKMQAEGAKTYAPEYVIDVQNLLRQARTKLEDEKDYITAQNNADNALRRANDGILRTQMKKAQEQIQEIETNIAKAVQLGAPVFVSDLYGKVLSNYEKMISDFETGEYQRVLDTADFVRPQVQTLLFETKKASARDSIETTQKVVDELDNMEVRTYLPGELEKVEEQLVQARTLFEQEKFEETEVVCDRALGETEKITEAFNDLAESEIDEGILRLSTAQELFNKLPQIFIINETPEMSELDRSFERNKSAYKLELQALLQAAGNELQTANFRQDEGRYNRAIIRAKEAQNKADTVTGEIYHIVAHNALVELSSQTSYYEREGARIYAREELDRTQRLIAEVRDLFTEKKFKEAMDKAAEARSQMELLVQAVAETANVNIENANKTIEKAPQYETERYRPEELAEAKRLVNEALTALAANQLKRSIELSQQASLLAQNASIESARQWASDAVEEATGKIQEAETAGATRYAGKTLQESKNLLERAEQNFNLPDVKDPQVYMTAKDQAVGASDMAEQALYQPIIEAEAAINEAKSAGGWDYDSKGLSQAIVEAKQARDYMIGKEYDQALASSKKAYDHAVKIANNSKNSSFKDRFETVEDDMNKGLDEGMNYFQVKEAQELLHKLIDAKKEYSTENFAKSMNDLDELQAMINNLNSRTPEILDEAVAYQQARLAKLKEVNAEGFSPQSFENAKLLLKYSRLDFEKGLYFASYKNLSKAIRTIDEVARNYVEEQYRMKATEILHALELNLDALGPVRDLSATVVIPMVKGTYKRTQSLTLIGRKGKGVNRVREEFEKLFLEVNAIDPPESMAVIHKELVSTVNTARLSSIYFAKFLILDQFDQRTTVNIVEEAYKLLDETDRKMSRLQELMTEQQIGIRMVDSN